MNKEHDTAVSPLGTDAEILALVAYASPELWGTNREQVALGHLVLKLMADHPSPMYLVAWPSGVRAMVSSCAPLGSLEMDRLVVKTYRAAAGGYIGPVAGDPL